MGGVQTAPGDDLIRLIIDQHQPAVLPFTGELAQEGVECAEVATRMGQPPQWNDLTIAVQFNSKWSAV